MLTADLCRRMPNSELAMWLGLMLAASRALTDEERAGTQLPEHIRLLSAEMLLRPETAAPEDVRPGDAHA